MNDSTQCDHPTDAIMWNEWNAATQCHRCGLRIERQQPETSTDGI